MVAVHLPHRDLALGVLPEDVGLAVAVEVAGVGDVPIGADRADRGVGGDVVAVHLPHRDLAAVVVQQDVGLAVAAEVAGRRRYAIPPEPNPPWCSRRCGCR